jgi:S1-C subfamily serine protease
MRNRYFTAALGLGLCCGTGSHALEPRDIFKLAEPSIVVVLAADAKGEKNVQASGVVIAPLEILTSCKVIEGAADIVVAQGSDLRPARVRFADLERDLCQLHLDQPLSSAKIAPSDASTNPQAGDELYLVSSPRGLNRTISRVMVSGLLPVSGTAAPIIQIDGMHDAGALGGGLFDQNGRLAGILTPQFRQGGGAAALPLNWATELPTRTADALNAPTPASKTATPAASATGETAKDARWHPSKGDRWNYRLVDGKRNVGTVSIQVVESSGGRVRERITKSDSTVFSVEREVPDDFQSRSFQPLVLLPGGYQLLELSSYFPPGSALTTGTKLGEVPGEVLVQMAGKRSTTWRASIAGVERVRVPAGELEAWKVVAETTLNMHYGDVKVVYNAWYSTAQQRPVKIAVATHWRITVQNTSETLELASYEPGK